MENITQNNTTLNTTSLAQPELAEKLVAPVTTMSWDDATWILTSSFIIFTMQSGFGLLESGMSDAKNEVNIMVKNAVDVIFGGLTFWMFGFGLSFGAGASSNPFCGVGHFFVDASEHEMGFIYSWFFFQLSFATTATTIVSGAMAGRTKLMAYIVFSFVNTLVYSLPAHWCWAVNGFLRKLGMVDISGAGAVHLVGGVSGFVATMILGPRTGRFTGRGPPAMGSPTNAILGMFMLWWGWLGFNCGSTFGISGGKWKLAARAAVVTVMSSMAGGAIAFVLSYIKTRKYDIATLVTGLLAALVSSTASCALVHPWEALIIGGVGSLLAILSEPVLVKLEIDDPVGVIPVHCVAGIWALLAVGLLTDDDTILGLTNGRKGLLKGGGWYLLGIQALSAVIIIVWSLITSYCTLKILDLVLGLRISIEDELLGADFVEHGIQHFDETIEEHFNPSIIQRDGRTVKRSLFYKCKWRTCLGSRRRRRKRKLDEQFHNSVSGANNNGLYYGPTSVGQNRGFVSIDDEIVNEQECKTRTRYQSVYPATTRTSSIAISSWL